jgi:hypothetical protein
MSVFYWNCWHFYGADKYNSYVKQYDSTINEAILETYSIKMEMYFLQFLLVFVRIYDFLSLFITSRRFLSLISATPI